MMGNDDFRKLKRYLIRLNTVLGELELLEDFKDVDYGEIASDLGFITVMLEQRRNRLMKRGRTL